MTKIQTISIQEKGYPEMLKKIKDPPSPLYFQGKILEKEKCFAVVGSRKCSLYGKEATFRIVSDLALAGLTIVSGLAPGIDTIAHKTALELKKRTIAVLGTGLEEKVIYPQENLALARKIVNEGGLLLSEYPPFTHGSKFTFPARNRLISGISLGVVVIEADLKSGALITAHWAKQQKRKIFAVPGSIYSRLSRGPHFLIKQGAILVESGQDILKVLGLEIKTTEKSKEEVEDKESELILKALEKGAQNINQIIEITKLAPKKVISLLSLMEIEGKVKNLGNNTFILNS
jgi:DNA processing protein